MTSRFSDMTPTSNLFWRSFVCLVKFSYWSKFCVNIITGSGVMPIFSYKELTSNPEIGNILSDFCSVSEIWDSKFGKNISNKMLLNAAKCQGYSFYRFWVNVQPPVIFQKMNFLKREGNSSVVWLWQSVILFELFHQEIIIDQYQ